MISAEDGSVAVTGARGFKRWILSGGNKHCRIVLRTQFFTTQFDTRLDKVGTQHICRHLICLVLPSSRIQHYSNCINRCSKESVFQSQVTHLLPPDISTIEFNMNCLSIVIVIFTVTRMHG